MEWFDKGDYIRKNKLWPDWKLAWTDFLNGDIHRAAAYNKIMPGQANILLHTPKVEIEKAFPKIKYIWLRRRDLVATTVSLYLARKTTISCVDTPERWHAQRTAKFEVNEKDLLKTFQEVRAKSMYWSGFVTDTPHLEVWYEDIYTDPTWFRRIFDFIGLRHTTVKLDVALQKIDHPATKHLTELLRSQLGDNL